MRVFRVDISRIKLYCNELFYFREIKYLKKSQHDDDRCNCVSRDVY